MSFACFARRLNKQAGSLPGREGSASIARCSTGFSVVTSRQPRRSSGRSSSVMFMHRMALKTAGKNALIPIQASALQRRPWNHDCDVGIRCETPGAAQRSCRIGPAGRMDRGLGATKPLTRSFVCCSTLSRRGSCQYYRAASRTVAWKLQSKSSVRTKRWSPGSRITAAHSIPPRLCGLPFRLHSRRQRSAISVFI